MAQVSRKLRCISRLLELNQSYSEMCEFLVEQKIIKQEEVGLYVREEERATFLYQTLQRADKEKLLQLVDYEWTILPLETIKIMCVAEDDVKEFSYGH